MLQPLLSCRISLPGAYCQMPYRKAPLQFLIWMDM